MNKSLPEKVKIFEVGPRDGLQNESQIIPTSLKLAFIEKLASSGLKNIEITSFVHPKAVPQLADAEDLLKQLHPRPDINFYALVPNEKGLQRALARGLKHIAVFTAASETFVKKNIGMSIKESLIEFQKVIGLAHSHGMNVRGYISTGFVCPYEGKIAAKTVLKICERLLDLGVTQVSIGDTIGAAVPSDIAATLTVILKKTPVEKLALHLHDTCGTALANAYTGLQLGITAFDTSAGGLGGCPYAPGAAGNLATEDLVYMLEQMGIKTGVNLEAVFQASTLIAKELQRDLPSRQWKRLSSAAPRMKG